MLPTLHSENETCVLLTTHICQIEELQQDELCNPFVLWTRQWCEQPERCPGYKEKVAEQMSSAILTEKMPDSLEAVSLGTKPVNKKHPWEEQLMSLKCIWVPRNQRHTQILSINENTMNCNCDLSYKKGENSLEKGENVWKSKNP